MEKWITLTFFLVFPMVKGFTKIYKNLQMWITHKKMWITHKKMWITHKKMWITFFEIFIPMWIKCG